MASLHLSLPYECNKVNFNVSSVHFSDSSHFSRFLNFVNATGSSVFYTHKHVQVSCFKSEFVDTSVNCDQVDGSFESSENDLHIVGENLMPTNSNSSRFVKGGRRKLWKRFDGVRRIEREKDSLKFDHVGGLNEQRYDVCDEINVSLYGIGPHSSFENCNKILRDLERSHDSKALKFFEWMRSKGKLKGNVKAYNLVLRVLGRRGDWGFVEKLIEEMKKESHCEVEFQVFNTILYACSKKGLVDIATKWFRMMLEYDVEPNVATFGMLMSLYQKGWNVEGAEYAFCKMRSFGVRCQSAYSAMITIYTRLGLHSKAEEVIDKLLEDEVVLNVENWLVLLNAYSQQGKMEEAERVLVSMHEARVPSNIVAYNTLITGYGKISNMDAAEQVLKSLNDVGLEPDETTYRSMIEGWARFGNYEKAKWYYEELKGLGYKPNSSNLYSLINLQAKHDDESGAIRTLDNMMEMGCQPPSILGSLIQAYEKSGRFDRVPSIVRGSLYEHVLDNQTACSILTMAYVKHSLVDDAIELLEHTQWIDPAYQDNLYHLLICSCKELGYLENAVTIFTHMPKSDDKPNMHIFSTMIDIFSMLNQFSDAENLYLLLKSSGVIMDMVAYSIVVRMYVKVGHLNDACLVLDAMEKQAGIVPDVYLLRDMLRVYQKCNKRNKLSDLYYNILKTGENWDQEMYNCVINCCAHALPIDEVSRLFEEMIQRGFTPNTVTYNVMLDVYGKSRLFRKAQKVLWMAKRQGLADVISYNTLIAAYSRNRDFKNMTKSVQQMEFNGFAVSLEAYNCMLDAYGKERQMEDFKNVLLKLKESSCTSDKYTYNIMMNIYGEQGWIEEVADVLTELKEYGPGPDLCSYNTLIKAYGIAGMVEDAVSTISQMRNRGIYPDKITYRNLINALRRNDKFLEAVRWSLWMKQMGLG